MFEFQLGYQRLETDDELRVRALNEDSARARQKEEYERLRKIFEKDET